MKFRFLVLLLCLLVATPALAQKLTNSDVVKMVEGRVPSPIIVHTIQTRAADFNLGPDALVELKKRGVPDAVLEAMMKKALAAAPVPAAPASAATPTGEWATRQSGVYLERTANGEKELVRLTEATIIGVKVGGGLGSALTYGIKKMKAKHQLRDATAPVRASSGQFTFYISQLNPRDLVILKVAKKGKGREFESGQIGGFTSVGIEAVEGDFKFTTEEVTPGVYRVVLAQPLAPGEYGFGVVGVGGIGPFYDFGIDR